MAVVKDSLTTESASSSPSATMLLAWGLAFRLIVWKNSAISSFVSLTNCPSIRRSSRARDERRTGHSIGCFIAPSCEVVARLPSGTRKSNKVRGILVDSHLDGVVLRGVSSRVIPRVTGRKHQLASSQSVRLLHRRADNDILPGSVYAAKHLGRRGIEFVGVDLAFNDIHPIATVSNDEIHFAVGLVLPIENIVR